MSRNIWSTPEWKNGRYHARITFPDGQISRLPLPREIPRTERSRAAALTEAIAGKFRSGERLQPTRRRPRVATDPNPAAGKYALVNVIHTWAHLRRDKGLDSWADSRGHLLNHVLPYLPADIRDVTRAHIEDVVVALEDKVAQGLLAAKTARRNVWGSVQKFFKDATRKRGFRLLDVNPCTDIDGPEVEEEDRTGAWLFPNEAMTLFACETIPLVRRRMYAVTIYLALRASELAALRVADWEPEAGRVHIHLQRDRRSGLLVPTKTCRPRYVPESTLAPLLTVLRADAVASGTEFLFPDLPPLEDLAAQLREDLRTAGLTRETLFANDKTRRHIRFHDLRASGITWWALAAVPPLSIKERAGHRNFTTTEIYIRAAETVGQGVGTPFPPATMLLSDSVMAPPSDDDPDPDDGGGGGRRRTIPADYPRNRNAASFVLLRGVPNGIRTRVAALKGPCPGPS